MKNKALTVSFIAGIMLVPVLTGCTQTPTRTSEVTDNRPMVMFEPSQRDRASEYIIYIDNLRVGTANQYLSPRNSLKLESGTHLIEIYRDGNIVYRDHVYLNEGSTITVHF